MIHIYGVMILTMVRVFEITEEAHFIQWCQLIIIECMIMIVCVWIWFFYLLLIWSFFVFLYYYVNINIWTMLSYALQKQISFVVYIQTLIYKELLLNVVYPRFLYPSVAHCTHMQFGVVPSYWKIHEISFKNALFLFVVLFGC